MFIGSFRTGVGGYMRKPSSSRKRLLSGALLLGAAAGLLWWERRRPLRRRFEAPWRRDLRNLGVAAVGALALQLCERPLSDPLADAVGRRRWGLLKQLPLPRWLELPLMVALMDYTLYVWHVGLHRIPLLWRMHRAHHSDLEVSASTAFRLHFTELALSGPWRAAQVSLLGVDRTGLEAWRTFTVLAILFHHSNLRLPLALERRLVRVIVTPRMHGIHHSIVPDEVDANWSSGLSLWDRLHGTLRLDRPQRDEALGLVDVRRPEEVRLKEALLLPFSRPRAPATSQRRLCPGER